MQHTTKRFILTSNQIRELKKNAEQDSSHKIPHPYKNTVKKNKRELKSTLDDPSLGEIDKVIKYTQGFNKYLKNLKSAVSLTKKQALFGKNLHSEPQDREEEDLPLLPSPSPSTTHLFQSSSSTPLDPISPISSSSFDKSSTPLTTPTPSKQIPPPPFQLSNTPVTTKSTRVGAKRFNKDKIINNFSNEKERAIAKKVLDTFEGSPNLHWNKNTGLVSVGGEPLKHTSIVGYIEDVIRGEDFYSTKRARRKITSKIVE